MKLGKEAKIGLFATTALVILYLGFNFLKGKAVFNHTHTYYAIYNHAKGLRTSGSVLLNGLHVGKVSTIDILPDKDYSVLVTLAVDKNIKLTDATVAKLVSDNLLGDKVIELSIKDGNPLQNRDTILGQAEQDFKKVFTEQTLPMLQDTKAIAVLTNQFMANLVENTERINATFANLEVITQKLRQAVTTNQTVLNTIGKNIAEASSMLSDREIGLEPLLTRLNQLANEVEAMKIKDMAVKLDNILGKLADGTLHDKLNHILIELDKLLVDLRTNPSRYVHFSIFGRNSGEKVPVADK